jgi:N-carbamoylputrescine amidase
MKRAASSEIKLGLIQTDVSPDPGVNLKKTIALIEQAAKRGAQIICTQELFRSQYFCQSEDHRHFLLAEKIPGPSTDAFQKLAKKHRVVIVASLFEKRATGLYHNTAVVFDRSAAIAGKYRKMHIPDDPAFYEKFYFTPGDIGFEPIDTAVGRLGVLVCWDQWYPEAARLMALAGADLLLYPTAIGWDPQDDQAEKDRQREAWVTVQRGHAVANGLPLLSCNRTGFEADKAGVTNGIQFWGTSFVAGPQGEFLAQASTDQRELLIVDVDMARSEHVRRIWPFLRDRRIDAYGDLLKRFRD